MTLNQLRYFVEVAERLSFTAAAEHLYMAQSTLSRQIALLEEEFGTAFFIREKGGLSMTPAGEIFFEEAKAALEREQQLRARLESAARGKLETLRLALPGESTPPETLLRAIQELRAKRPEIDLTVKVLDVHEMYMQLESGAIDAAYANNHTVELVESVIQLPFSDKPMYLAASHLYPLAPEGALTAERLNAIIARGELMVLDPALFGQEMVPRLRKLLGLSLSGIRLDQLWYMQSDAQLTANIVCGLGAAMVHGAHRLCNTPGVVLSAVPEDVTPIHFVLAYREKNANPVLPLFLSMVRRQLARGANAEKKEPDAIVR